MADAVFASSHDDPTRMDLVPVSHDMMSNGAPTSHNQTEVGEGNPTEMARLCADILSAEGVDMVGAVVANSAPGQTAAVTVSQTAAGPQEGQAGEQKGEHSTGEGSKLPSSLEGQPVFYKGKNGEVVLTGTLKDNGVLCNCQVCGGKEIVSTTMFENHAGSTARRPGDNIILSDGQSLRTHKSLHGVPGSLKRRGVIKDSTGESKPKKRRVMGQKAMKERRQQFLDNIQTLLTPHLQPEALASILEEAKELMLTDQERQQRMAYRALAARSRFMPMPAKRAIPRMGQLQGLARSPVTPLDQTLSARKPYLCNRCGERKAGHQCTGVFPPGSGPMTAAVQKAAGVKSPSSISPLGGGSGRKHSGRSLLTTGLLEGRPVTYRAAGGQTVLLTGVIRDTGVLCDCKECNGQKVVSLCQFEIHAGSTARHPTDNIYLDDNRTLRDHVNMHQLGDIPAMSKIDTMLRRDKAYKVTAQSPPVVRQESTKTRSRDMPGIFQSDAGVAEGERLVYRVSGQDFLGGFKKGPAILCDCCKSPVSPSQFEQHAGFGQRRRPYDAIVVVSKGLTLKQIADNLKAGGQMVSLPQVALPALQSAPHQQQQQSNTPQEVCSTCGQGGELLLCDSCPNVYHLRCVGLDQVPEGGNWHCPECLTKQVDNAVNAAQQNGVVA